jgi:hypothetical protein
MSARDLTPEQINAVDRFIAGPPGGNPRKARARQTVTAARMVCAIDKLLAEAADCRIPAPGLIEIREWLVFNIEENVAAAAPPLPAIDWNDPVKAAVTNSTAAAVKGDKAAYAAARVAEVKARAAA